MRIEIAVDARNRLGEGPFWDDREDRLWWVDIRAREILAWRPGEAAPQRWPTPDFPSAIVARERGGYLVAMRRGLAFWESDTQRFEPFVAPDAARPGNRSNDAKCDPFGRFWLGTMQNNLNEDGSDKETSGATGALYCVGPDGRWTLEVDGIGIPNTLAWTDGGRSLLFADTLTGVIAKFDIDEDGRLANRRVFAGALLAGFCDSSTIDAEGCLWNARYAGGLLIRFRPDGSVEREVPLPVANPTSCCFGGPDLRTLYVTSAREGLSAEQLARSPHEGAVLAIDAGVAGTPSHRFAG